MGDTKTGIIIDYFDQGAREETMLESQLLSFYYTELKHFGGRFTYKLLLLGDFCQVISYRNILCSDEYVELERGLVCS